ASAGILYRKRTDGYYALALSAGATIQFVHNTGNRLQIVSTWSLDGTKDGDAVHLRIEGDGGKLRLFVREKQIDTVSVPESDEKGDPGVFAVGHGCFRFDDVVLAHPKQESR